MTGQRFDDLTITLSRSTSRRAVLKALAATALGGALARVGRRSADAAVRPACSRLNEPCSASLPCCAGAGICSAANGSTCRKAANERCIDDTDCCCGNVCRQKTTRSALRYCLALAALHQLCDTSEDCAGGLSCNPVTNTCLRNTGQPCTGGGDCLSGTCASGQCVVQETCDAQHPCPNGCCPKLGQPVCQPGTTDLYCGAVGGICSDCIGADETCCNRTCADTKSSTQHCGSCNHACAENVVCDNGECVCGSFSGATPCNGPNERCCPVESGGNECHDITKSLNHCGGCNQPCDPGDQCVNGQCCPQGCVSDDRCCPADQMCMGCLGGEALCCPPNQGCSTCPDNTRVCCPDGQRCSACQDGSRICCPDGQFCNNGVCSGVANPCANPNSTGSACDPNDPLKRCCSGVCMTVPQIPCSSTGECAAFAPCCAPLFDVICGVFEGQGQCTCDFGLG